MTEPYYQDESVTLYHGDCRDHLGSRFVRADTHALVTDPPYGIASIWKGGSSHGWENARSDTSRREWDAEAPLFVPSLPQRYGHSIIWGGNYFSLPPARGWLIWDKMVRQFTSGHAELAWTTLDQPIRAFNFANGQLATEGKFHPTQKPVGLMTWCIRFLPETVQQIVDPFAGSGTTLVAAKAEGRKAFGVEREERYCEIAAQRLSQGVLAFGDAS